MTAALAACGHAPVDDERAVPAVITSPAAASTTAAPRPVTDAAPAEAAAPPPAYAAAVGAITPEPAARMQASWRPGCPVPLEDLRYLTLTHHDMTGGVVTGELVVHADDDASMAADNTSAFNCPAVTGGTGWSEHSYGRAVDVNPVENPYVRGTTVLPPAGAAFVDRHAAPGVILDGDVVVQAFAAHGWQWGGHWTSPKDYQHFSTTGR